MKHIKNRLLLVLLVLVTVLTLLPTTAMAATSTGTGIKATTNSNYWTTRLLTDGTPYSYRPPVAAGKTLYCCDRGYGYRWGTESFLNSYTYTSATGADADEVLKNALALSGLGELDAQQLENGFQQIGQHRLGIRAHGRRDIVDDGPHAVGSGH